MRSNLLKCTQYCTNVLKYVQKCLNMFKCVHNCVQMCPIAFKCVQMCSNAVSSIMRSGQLSNRGFKPGFTSPPSSSTFLSALVFIHFLPPAWLIPPILLFPCYIVLATFYLDHLHQVVPPPSLPSPRSHFSLLLLFPLLCLPLWPIPEDLCDHSVNRFNSYPASTVLLLCNVCWRPCV